jgi:seryl-tRNA(Sec) selenium transferase
VIKKLSDTADRNEIFRSLPGVDTLLEADSIGKIIETVPRELVTRAIRDVLDETRVLIANGEVTTVINVDEIALKAVQRTNQILEPGIALSGKVSKLSILMNILSGAEETLPISSMSNAIILALESIKTRCREDENCVLIPSTHLVYMKPFGYLENMIKASGVKIIETGCTNRIHLKDLKKKLTESAGKIRTILLSDKPNTKTLGFTKELNAREVAELAGEFKIPLIMVHWETKTDHITSACPPVDSEHTTSKNSHGDSSSDGNSPSMKHSITTGADLVISPTNFFQDGLDGAIIYGTSEAIARLKGQELSSKVAMNPIQRKHLEDALYKELIG